jgi:hypothetical protein
MRYTLQAKREIVMTVDRLHQYFSFFAYIDA